MNSWRSLLKSETFIEAVADLVLHGVKYSDNQPRDYHGRWTSGNDVGETVGNIVTGVKVEAFHGTIFQFDHFSEPSDYQNTMVDMLLGPHFAADPELANRFAGGLYRTGFGVRGGENETRYAEGGRVIPAELQFDKMREVVQQHPYLSDQTAIGAEVARTVFPQRKDLFVEWMMNNRKVTEEVANRTWEALRDGKEVTADIAGDGNAHTKESAKYMGLPYDFGSYVHEYGGVLFYGLDKKEYIDSYKSLMSFQNIQGLKYQNTSPMETAGIKNKTCYIVLDKKAIKPYLKFFGLSAILKFSEDQPRDWRGRFAVTEDAESKPDAPVYHGTLAGNVASIRREGLNTTWGTLGSGVYAAKMEDAANWAITRWCQKNKLYPKDAPENAKVAIIKCKREGFEERLGTYIKAGKVPPEDIIDVMVFRVRDWQKANPTKAVDDHLYFAVVNDAQVKVKHVTSKSFMSRSLTKVQKRNWEERWRRITAKHEKEFAGKLRSAFAGIRREMLGPTKKGISAIFKYSDDQPRDYRGRFTDLLHGTFAGFKEDILKEGIIAGGKHQNYNYASEGRANSVYMTTFDQTALMFAENAAKGFLAGFNVPREKIRLVLFHIDVPKGTPLKEDEALKHTSARYEGNVPPSWIKGYDIYKYKKDAGDWQIVETRKVKGDAVRYYVPLIFVDLEEKKKGIITKANFDYEGWEFDIDKWQEMFEALEGEFVKGMYDLIGNEVYDHLHYVTESPNLVGRFDVKNPNVQEFIDDYSYKFAEEAMTNLVEQVRSVIDEGMSEGLGDRDISAKLQEVFDYREASYSDMVARTETIRASNYGAIESYKQSGVVRAKEWLCTEDDRLCTFCSAMNGTQIELDDNFFDEGDDFKVSGSMLAMDYEDVGGPPLHPNCRCTLVPVVDEQFLPQEEEEKMIGLSAIFKYSDDQPRDERGRWTSGAQGSLPLDEVTPKRDSYVRIATDDISDSMMRNLTRAGASKEVLATIFSTVKADSATLEIRGYQGRYNLSCTWEMKNADGDMVPRGTFSMNVQDDHAHLGLFKLDQELENKQAARTILEKLDPILKKMGVTEMSLLANISIGTYAWARMGFDYENEYERNNALERMVKYVKQQMKDNGEKMPLKVKRQILAFKTAQEVASFSLPGYYKKASDFGVENWNVHPDSMMHLGKAYMLDTRYPEGHGSWNGIRKL